MYSPNGALDLDAFPLYVDARTEVEFDIALDRDFDVVDLFGGARRALNIGSWLTAMDRRFPLKVEFPADSLPN